MGLVLAVLTGAGDGEVVVLEAHLDVGSAETRHLHGDGVALVGLVNVSSWLGRTVIAIAATDEVLEEDVEGCAGTAIHEIEHVTLLLC